MKILKLHPLCKSFYIKGNFTLRVVTKLHYSHCQSRNESMTVYESVQNLSIKLQPTLIPELIL